MLLFPESGPKKNFRVNGFTKTVTLHLRSIVPNVQRHMAILLFLVHPSRPRARVQRPIPLGPSGPNTLALPSLVARVVTTPIAAAVIATATAAIITTPITAAVIATATAAIIATPITAAVIATTTATATSVATAAAIAVAAPVPVIASRQAPVVAGSGRRRQGGGRQGRPFCRLLCRTCRRLCLECLQALLLLLLRLRLLGPVLAAGAQPCPQPARLPVFHCATALNVH